MGCVGVGRWADHDLDTVGVCSVHSLVICGSARGTVGTANWSVVVPDALRAEGSGAGVEISCVGGGADTSLGGRLATHLSVADAPASMALGRVGGGRPGEPEEAAAVEQINIFGPKDDRRARKGYNDCAAPFLREDLVAGEPAWWLSEGETRGDVDFLRHLPG